MNSIFKSILKDEMSSFIEFIKLSYVDWKAFQRTLIRVDSFLHLKGISKKNIDDYQISRWFESLNVSLSTKKCNLSHLKKFSVYLSTLGIKLCLPELPRNTTEFKPYVYSTDEITRIFEAVDDFAYTNPKTSIALGLPVLLRVLYGCGLRIGEAVSLTWDDIDLTEGIITVKAAKNKKQRFVPMSDELTRILRLYKTFPCFDKKSRGFLFIKNKGQPLHKASYWKILSDILCELGIKNKQTVKYGSRGPCMHSFRHTFTFHSLLKADSEGRGFMETVPFLSTYLGHERLTYTDTYLKARYELYTKFHATIADYIGDVFPLEV
jgi:integrase